MSALFISWRQKEFIRFLYVFLLKARLLKAMDFAVSTARVDSFEVETHCTFEDIVRLHRLRVFRLMLASLQDGEAAENLTQDCFLRAYKAFGAFRYECKVSTWLMQIAVNLLRDHARNKRLQFWRRLRRDAVRMERDMADTIADDARSPEEQAMLAQQANQIWRAAEALSEKQKLVFLLRFVEDMDIADIALATGMQPATVKTHLLRALVAVRQTLGARS